MKLYCLVSNGRCRLSVSFIPDEWVPCFFESMLSPVGAVKNVALGESGILLTYIDLVKIWERLRICSQMYPVCLKMPKMPQDAWRVERKAKKRLEQARLAFLVDLWKLRGLVERITRAAEEDISESTAGVLSEATHIHFFVPCQTNCVGVCQYFLVV